MKPIKLLLLSILLSVGMKAQTPIASYPFTGNANDAVGSNHGTVNGATLTNDRFGNPNSAYSFDGVDDFIELGNLNFAGNDYTISFWVNLNSTTTDNTVFSGADPSVLTNTYILSELNNGVGRFLHRNPAGNSGGVDLSGVQTLPSNSWKFVSCVKQGITLTYYVNGQLDNTVTNAAATNISSSIFIELGRLRNGSNSFIRYLNGKLDDLKIYNTALSAAQIMAESSSPIASYPFTGNANDAIGTNHGTVSGATLTTDRFGNANSAYSFDGVDDYIEVADNNLIDLSTNFTISVWIFPTVNSAIGTIINKENSYEISRHPDGTIQYALSANGTGSDWAWVNTNIVAPLNAWSYITFVKTGSNVQVYLNAVNGHTNSAQPASLAANTSNLRIGERTFTPEVFAGKLDDIKIYNTALSAVQVLNEYNSSSNNLVAYYPFNANANDAVGTKHGNVNGATLTTDRFGNTNSAYSFDGVDDVVELNHAFNGFTELTISAWVKLNGANQANDLQAIISSDASGKFLHLQTIPGAPTNCAVYLDGNNYILLDHPTPAINTWYQVTLVAKSGASKVYINGIEVFSDASTFSTISNTNLLRIGSGYQNGRFFNGAIDEIKIYSTALTAAQVLAEYNPGLNLIASYSFSGNVNDSSGNNLHGTIIGSPSFTTDRNGNPNGAIAFNSNVANRVEVDDNILLHTPSITIASWVKFNSLAGSHQGVVDKPLGTNVSDSWHFGTQGSNFSVWHMNSGPNFNPYSQVTSPIIAGHWYYAVSTFDNTTKEHKLYIDGVLKMTNSFNSTIGYDNSKMYFGVALESNALNFPMDGVIDEVKIYGDALSQQQIQNEFINQVTINSKGSGNALSLDGSDDYVELPAILDGATQFSIDFWVKTTENRSGGTYWQHPTMIGNANPSSPDGDFGIVLNNGQLAVWHGLCCSDQSLQTTKVINDNQWHHIAVVNNGSTMVLYADGILLPGSIPTNNGAIQNSARPWRIGMNNSCCVGNWPFAGTIDEIRFWNNALSETQIRERMCRKLTNGDALFSNLVAYFNFDESDGSTALDGSSHENLSALFNGATRVTSGAPIGNSSSFNYAGAASSVNHTNPSLGDDVTATLTAGAADGIHVYHVNESPNSTAGVSGLENANTYFGTFVAGGTSPTYSISYNYDGISGITNENGLVLATRANNSVTTWNGIVSNLNTTANTLSVSSVNNSQAEYRVAALDPGLVSSSQANCFAYTPNPLTATPAFNNDPATTYQWQDSIVGGTWQNISGATSMNSLVLPLATSTKFYRRLATLSSTSLSSNVVTIEAYNAAHPSTVPINEWNLYAYDGTNVDSVGVIFKGSYTRTSLGINTITDYGSGNNPSTASGYNGCAMIAPNNMYSLYAKRKGFPVGSYALNIPQHDDEIKIFKDGVLLTSAGCCNNLSPQYFTLTTLDANSVIECRMTNSGGGPGHMMVDIFLQNLNGGIISSNQSNCEAFTPTLLNNIHAAYGGSSTTISYQWQESSNNINFTDITGATTLTYQPLVVNADKYYRRKAINSNNEIAFSNVVFMDINGTTFYADVDGDGFGDPNNTVQACTAPIGYLTNNTDCNDNDTLEKPGQVWFLDADNDGYKANNTTLTQCSRPLNYKAFSELLSDQRDCNDNNNHIHPGAQYLSFSGANNYVSNICNPLLGDAFTNFRYEVMYFNIYNEMPENGAPRLSVDLGQDFILNPGDKRVSMQQDDINDTNTQDGKKYFLNISGIQPGVALQSYVSPHLINCDYFGPFLNEPLVVNFPNLSIAAADITFNNYNPDVSTSITVTAVVKNPSSYAATNIPVRLVNQFDTTQIFPVQTIAFIPNASEATVSWTITTPSLSGLCPMKVIVDYGNTLNETNENDNTAIRGFVNGNGSVSGGIAVTSSVSPKTVLTGAGNPGYATLTGTAQYTGLAFALNNAAVPGAEVSCTLIETGQTFMGVTDANGNFSIPFAAPIGAGTYHFSGTVYDFTWAGFMQVDSNAFTVVPAVGQSDLVPTLNMQSPTQIVVGEKIKVNYRSNNNGFISTAANHKCKLSISGPSGFSLEDSTTINVLVNNTSSPEITVETAPLNVSGTYIVTVSTDTDDEEVESNESNNSLTTIVNVQPQQMDVVGQGVQVIGGNTLCNSSQITIQAEVKNLGSIATSAGHVSSMTLKQGGTVLGTQTFNIPILPSNQASIISKTFVVPYMPNTYTVELAVDMNNTLLESNESNNVISFPITLDTCKADLSLAEFCNNVAIQATANDYSGGVTLKTIIKNNGDQIITQPVRVRFQFDNSNFFDYVHSLAIAPDDIVPIELPIAAIPVNASSLQVIIDPLNTIDETSNTNNTSETKALGLDFSPVAEGCVTPINGYAYYTGGFVTFYSSIKSANLFSRDSVKVNFKLSGPGISGLQTMGSTYIYNVSPTCFCPQVASIPTLHLISLPGTYQIHVTVDPDNDIIETNETNNEIVYSITTQDLPDMHLNSTFINPSNLNPTAGQSITTQVTYGNIGIGNVGDVMKLKLYIDNIAIDSVVNATGLPSNGTTTYTFNTPWSSTQSGVHLIRTTIDADNTITEIDENNNMAVRAIVVGDAANMYFDSLGSLNLYPQLGDSALIYADIGNNGTLACTSLLTFYFLNDFNDTLLIRNYTMTVAPNGHQIITFKWKVIDEKTVVVAKLTNSTVQEFDYADNSASFAFGQMKLITEAIPACNAGNQGSITAHVLGGSPPFTYAWSNNTNSSTVIGAPGNYAVTVFDQSGQQIQGNDSIPVCMGGLLYVKCLLQGFYAGNASMYPVLTQSGLLSPLSFTDTVTVELHENSAGFPLSSSFTGIIHSNGQINCHVPLNEIGTSRYLVIKHRNHVETWSANPVLITNNVVFDFTTAASQAFGDNQSESEPGIYTLISGDINHDNGIDVFDYLEMDPDIINGAFGYLNTDLNGDGSVDAFDYIVIDPNIISGISAATP
ncbi:MAG: hypothetical protein JNM95_10140 [Chitinophagaceae bacterium]|nr:hypothetical protein [Chitinophagaceae bacterium]